MDDYYYYYCINFSRNRSIMMKMDRTCKKCNHLCHCIEADHEGCKCTGCDCDSGRAEQATYEGGGVVIDDTNECESCQ